MELQINNIKVFVQAMSLIFDVHQVYIQWNLLVQDPATQNWLPDGQNCTVGLMIDGQTDYDAFLALNRDQQDAQLVTYLQTLYPVT